MAKQIRPWDLLEAARSGDVEKVMKLFDVSSNDQPDGQDCRAARLNVKNNDGQTALHLAVCVCNHHDVTMKTLVRAGVDVNLADKDGLTPLMFAVARNKRTKYSFCIRELIQLDADINCVDVLGRNAVMLAALHGQDDCLKLLIEAGADVKLQAKMKCDDEKHHGPTALIYAAENHHASCLKLLLQAGADVNFQTSDGATALMVALNITQTDDVINYSNIAECVKVLIHSGADVNFQSSEGNSALMILVKDFPRKRDINGSEISVCMRIFIDSGVDVNLQATNGETALMLLVRKAATEKCIDYLAAIECVTILIEYGADVTLKYPNGQTVMMYTARENSLYYLLHIFKNAGAALDEQDSNGMTALAHAIESESYECVRWLVDSGADVTRINNNGQTALMYAARHDCLFDLLPEIKRAGADVDQQDTSGMTALIYAINAEDDKLVGWLVDSGASVNIRDHSGKSPLHYLMSSNCKDEKKKRCLEILLGKEVDVNAKDSDGMTPLMYAAQRSVPTEISFIFLMAENTKQKRTITTLLEHGAEINATDNSGQTALIHSLMNVHPPYREGPYYNPSDDQSIQIIRFLLGKGANFSIGRLAAGPISKLAILPCDLDLTKLKIGDDVDLHLPWNIFEALIMKGNRRILQCLIVNGVMPPEPVPRGMSLPSGVSPNFLLSLTARSTSMVEMAVKEGNIGVTKYLIAICYLLRSDLTFFRASYTGLNALPLNRNIVKVLENLHSQPWPLVKLCFVAVSTAFGASPGRQERVKNSQLPPKLQKMLLFQEPWSRLCVHRWDKIHLTFNWEKYEKLPRPRPLLYHWPVGRPLVPCGCGECDGAAYKYERSNRKRKVTET